jgi:hypothetical protein
MRKVILGIGLLAAASLALVGTAVADHDEDGRVRASLDGYQEVVGPGSISTIGRGRFTAEIHQQRIDYRLTYTLENPATQAHIHFAERHVGGGVSAFLCGGGSKPPCPPGVGAEATVTGTITAADVIGPANQGIEPGSFAELVRAIRAGATYVNVHSTRWPAGEIRGQIGGGDDDDD